MEAKRRFNPDSLEAFHVRVREEPERIEITLQKSFDAVLTYKPRRIHLRVLAGKGTQQRNTKPRQAIGYEIQPVACRLLCEMKAAA